MKAANNWTLLWQYSKKQYRYINQTPCRAPRCALHKSVVQQVVLIRSLSSPLHSTGSMQPWKKKPAVKTKQKKRIDYQVTCLKFKQSNNWLNAQIKLYSHVVNKRSTRYLRVAVSWTFPQKGCESRQVSTGLSHWRAGPAHLHSKEWPVKEGKSWCRPELLHCKKWILRKC